MAGPSVPQAHPGLCFPWLCYEPDPLLDLCFMLSGGALPTPGVGLFPCLPHLTTASPEMWIRQVKSWSDPTPLAPGQLLEGPAVDLIFSQWCPSLRERYRGRARGTGGEMGLNVPLPTCLTSGFWSVWPLIHESIKEPRDKSLSLCL